MGNCLSLNSHSPHSSPFSARPPERILQMPVRNRSFDAFRGPFKRRRRHAIASQGALHTLTADLIQHYDLGKELGKGQFGIIRQCTEKATGKSYACKSISKMKLTSQQEMDDVRREIEIMCHLSGHPNVVRLKEVYEDKAFVHMVMELCEGGELFDRIVKRHSYSEREAAILIKSLVEVIKYCHDLGIMHRDLKPENILLATTSPTSPIKLADFGLALRFSPGQRFSGMAGSAYYIAPEVLNGYYSHEVDLWSIGVILYVLLSGVPPFWGETENNIFEAIKEGNLDFVSNPWPEISPSAKHLIRRLLCPDAKARLTSEQVLQHPWILRHTLERANSQHKRPAEQKPTRDGIAETTEKATVRPCPYEVSDDVTAVFRQSEAFSFNNSMEARECASNLPLQPIFPEATLDGASMALEMTPSAPLAQSLFPSVATAADCAMLLPCQSSLSVSSPAKRFSTSESSCHGSSSSSSFTSQSTCHDDFDRWASFSQVAEPTMSEFLSAIISNLQSIHLPYLQDSTQIRLQDGSTCTCTILKASQKKQLIVVNVKRGNFLVFHDKDKKSIGWRLLERAQVDSIMLDPSTLWWSSDSRAFCWSSCPISPFMQHTQFAF